MSFNEQMLAAYQAALLAIVTGRAESYTINGRSYTALDIAELEAGVDRYERKVSRATRPMMGVVTFRSPR